MSAGERDPHTGHMTTGHEWNGIKELNTPVPRPVWFFLIVTALFSLVYWVLMPAWPLGVTYTRGLLGMDQQDRVERQVSEARADRAVWMSRFAEEDFAAIQADDALMSRMRQMGPALFEDNCAVCHGRGGKGGPGYPSLADNAWLWGGSPEEIAETLRVGINSAHEDTRFGQMMAFRGVLSGEEIANVVDYVLSLSSKEAPLSPSAEAGKEVFAQQCVACHGEDGTGLTEFGAPNLTDDHWIYGGSWQAISRTVSQGRQGHMPAWEGRLTEAERKLLALYVLDLQKAE